MSLVWEFGVGGVGGSGEQERVLQGSEVARVCRSYTITGVLNPGYILRSPEEPSKLPRPGPTLMFFI